MLTLQYLEPGPHLADLTPLAIAAKLTAAFDLLPVDNLLLGWNLPPQLIETCRRITDRYHVKLYRWQPILTGDGEIFPKEEWRARNLERLPLSGFRSLPEFTFICPNHPAARQAILTHLSELPRSGLYDGIFLDRMRYPSPAEDPIQKLTCFCDHCQRVAADQNIDLTEVFQHLLTLHPLGVLGDLCGETTSPLSTFLDFRQQTITAFIHQVVDITRSAGLEVGLDCFSPCLTHMVGQDLGALAPLADWTKLMLYGHARGPATLPFEIGALAIWMVNHADITESSALGQLADWMNLKLPTTLTSLNTIGLAADALATEYSRGRQSAASGLLLAGIELVEMAGVSELNSAQIKADLLAFQAAGADGFSLSWDLWHIPLERLQIVRDVWQSTL